MTSKFFFDEDICVVIVKPEGVKRGLVGEIISRFEKSGIEIDEIRFFKPGLSLARLHYKEHSEKDFFDRITNSLSSGKVCVFVIKCKDAVKIARAKIGESSDPTKCKPGTIRADFAHKMSENVVHASDSDEAARREYKLWISCYHSSTIMQLDDEALNVFK